jgi:uncharacterized protein YcnI
MFTTTKRNVLRSIVSGVVASAVGLLLWAAPAAAHPHWDPGTAAPGSVIDLTLFMEDEQPSGGTNRVDLQFPEPITIVALPAVPGWTATVVGGRVGAPATGVSWVGGPQPEDLSLPIRLGPLPNEARRLQFRAVQTYDNGVVENWVADFPAGGAEPDNPGPVLDLVPGGPGSIPPPTTTTVSPTTTTEAEETTTTAGEDEEAAQTEDGDDDGSALPLVLGVAGFAAVGAAVAFTVNRARRKTDSRK